MIYKEKYDDSYRRFTVNLGLDYNFFGYLHTFENAIEIMMDDVADTGTHADRISYPILFMIRHCLELGLKANIGHFSKYSGKVDHTRSNTHKLIPLLQAFKLHIDGTTKVLQKIHNVVIGNDDLDEFQAYFLKTDTFLKQISVLDEKSYAFRYPRDNKYEKIFRHDQQVNLVDIIRQFDECMLLITHMKDAWSIYTKVIDDSRRSEQEPSDH